MAGRQSCNRRTVLHLFAALAALTASSVAAQAESEGRCNTYANSAIADYRQLRNIPKCSKLRPKDTVRWHPQFKLHFDWCLGANIAALNSETKKRDDLLLSCGGRSKL